MISLIRFNNKWNIKTSKKYEKGKFSRSLFFLDLSSRWDFICSFPVVFYICKGLGVFTIPTALLVSLLILITANYAGLYTVQKSNKYFRIFLSLILLILMFVRISFSGIGIQLATQSDYLKEHKALEVLSQRNLLNTQRPKMFSDELYKNANEECNRLAEEQSNLDISKESQRRQWSKLQKQMYASPEDLDTSDTDNLLINFSEQLGSCTIRNYINNLNNVVDQNISESLSNLTKLEDELSPLALLYIRARGSYYSYFNGDALAGEPFEMSWLTIDPNLGIQVSEDCADQDEKCSGPVRWASGNEAIKAATINFYEKYSRRDFNSLGFSFLGFFISLVLNLITLISFIILPKKSK